MPPMLLFALCASASPRALSLDDAVQLALARAPTVDAAEAAYQRADVATLRAQLDRFRGTVDLQLQELWVRTQIGGAREDAFSGFLGLSNAAARLEVPAFSGFRVEATVEQAKHLERAARLDVAEERRALALAVARAYWAVQRVALLLDVEQRALERLSGAESIAAARVDSGLAAPIDVNRAKSRGAFVAATVADLEGQLQEASAAIAVLLGIEGPVVLSDRPAEPDTPPTVEALMASAQETRADLRAAASREAAQREAIRIARSGYYPQLDVFGLLQVGNNPFVAGAGARNVFPTANPFDNVAADFQAGVTLSLNVFDTLNTYTAVKTEEYGALRAEKLARQTGRVVEQEVRAARARVVRLLTLLERLRPVEALAEDNLTINRARYENGEALVFELLDSQLELLDVQRRITAAAADLTLAGLELEAAQGEVLGGRR